MGRDVLWIGALMLPWALASVVFAPLNAFPTNDDWLYAHSVRYLVEQGRWVTVSHNGQVPASAMVPIGMGAFLCQWTGFRFETLHAVSKLLALLGPIGCFLMGRFSGVSSAIAGLFAMTLLTNPWYFGHGFTFMTDASSVGLGLLASAVLFFGLERNSLINLVIGSLLLGLAVGSRQTTLALALVPILICLGHCWHRRATISRTVAWIAVACFGSFLMLGLMEIGLLGPTNRERLDFVIQRPGFWDWMKNTGRAGYGAILVVSASLLPMAPIMWTSLRWKPITKGAFAVGLIPMIVFVIRGGGATIGQATGPFVTNAHFGPVLCSDCMDPGRWNQLGVTWPGGPWFMWTIGSLLTAPIILASAADAGERLFRRRSQDMLAPLAWFVTGSLAGIGLLFLMGFHFDRYWIIAFAPLIVFGMLKHDRTARPPSWIMMTSLLLMGSQGMISMVFTHDWLAFNQARWKLQQQYLSDGYSAEQIDGGYEINGWNRAFLDPQTRPVQGFESTRWWSGHAERWLAVGPRPGMEVDREVPWFSWATGRWISVLGLRRSVGNPGDL